jgi:SAM-dependent methyltransferase
MTALAVHTARDAYDTLAGAYDVLTAHHRHDRWLAQIERLAVEHGVHGRRALDIACGTGKSFAPLLERGWQVMACDVSPAMVERARVRHPDGSGAVVVADMRTLPDLGSFDLVTCLDDAVNYLLEPRDLLAAFQSAARCLREGGLYVFDVNTLATYRGSFASDQILERDSTVFCWHGAASDRDASPGAMVAAAIDIFARDGERWRRSTSWHVQRHHPPETVRAALRDAGLRCVRMLGQRPGAVLNDVPDDSADTKHVYLAERPRSAVACDQREEVPNGNHHPVTNAAAAGGQTAAGGRFRAAAGVSIAGAAQRAVALGAAVAPPHGVRHLGVPFSGDRVF